jgi:hypothetical protein
MKEFIEITTKLSAVVACRCSPTQKADVARLIRKHTKKRVCCIGDGGNDVSMIQAADVGKYDSLSCDALLICGMSRCRHRWERRKTSVLGRRFFSDPIQLSNQTVNVARSEFLPTICQACTVCHPSRTSHFSHASGVFVHILFRANCSVSRVVVGWICDCVYDGAGVFPRVGSGCE